MKIELNFLIEVSYLYILGGYIPATHQEMFFCPNAKNIKTKSEPGKLSSCKRLSWKDIYAENSISRSKQDIKKFLSFQSF